MSSLTDQLGFNFRPPQRRVWTVRDLVAAVRSHIEREYSDAWVEGEISNFRAPDSGHLYFTLKDGNAQIRVVMFRTAARLLRFRPADGMQVVVRGRVTIYEDRGELQISADYIEPKGAGALQIAFEQLKAKLEAEGLFATERKKPIPALPARIGIVTSPQAAALRDILNILQRRHHTVNVLIYPAQVQGEAAALEVATAVRYFSTQQNVDVVIVARGGGSAEDLAAFNNEGLARAVAASAVPEDHTNALYERLTRAIRYRLLIGRQTLTELAQHGAFARIMDGINQRQQKLDDLTYRLELAERALLEQMRRRWETTSAAIRHYDLRLVLSGMRRQMDAATAALVSVMRNVLLQHRVRADRMMTVLESLSPLAILERGYALVFDSSGKLLKDAAQVQAGDEITARLARGEIQATVTTKRP